MQTKPFSIVQKVKSGEYLVVKIKENLLGCSGFGQVYKGEWRGHAVAVKYFKHYDYFSGEFMINCALIESKSGICGALAADFSEKCLIFPLFEYDGASTVVGKLKCGAVNNLKEFVVRMAVVLQHLHKTGVLHNDLKRDNFIINSQGLPVLIDFGNSTSVHDKYTAFLFLFYKWTLF